jgi:hypothetical protein
LAKSLPYELARSRRSSKSPRWVAAASATAQSPPLPSICAEAGRSRLRARNASNAAWPGRRDKTWEFGPLGGDARIAGRAGPSRSYRRASQGTHKLDELGERSRPRMRRLHCPQMIPSMISVNRATTNGWPQWVGAAGTDDCSGVACELKAMSEIAYHAGGKVAETDQTAIAAMRVRRVGPGRTQARWKRELRWCQAPIKALGENKSAVRCDTTKTVRNAHRDRRGLPKMRCRVSSDATFTAKSARLLSDDPATRAFVGASRVSARLRRRHQCTELRLHGAAVLSRRCL